MNILYVCFCDWVGGKLRARGSGNVGCVTSRKNGKKPKQLDGRWEEMWAGVGWGLSEENDGEGERLIRK